MMINKKFTITNFQVRKILNSHCQWTIEVGLEIDKKTEGIGSSPSGETKSMFEDKRHISLTKTKNILKKVKNKSFSQCELDNYLYKKINVLSHNEIYAVSTAFFNATNQSKYFSNQTLPKILLNIINGGLHAYTNPVFSDFAEYLLVPKQNNITKIIKDFHIINEVIKKQLNTKPTLYVNNNRVFYLGDELKDIINFIFESLKKVNLEQDYELMIDASITNFSPKKKLYHLPVTNKKLTSRQLYFFWRKILNNYPIKILEDPFSEIDLQNWKKLNLRLDKNTYLTSDNLFSTNPERLLMNKKENLVTATLLKPNQAITVSRLIKFYKEAKKQKLLTISSHRSIETENMFLPSISNMLNIDMIKIGHINSFDAIIKINEFIRLINE